MCQVEEEYDDTLRREEPPSVSQKCMRCREHPAEVLIRAGDSFCRDCFKDAFVHKFRATLGKHRIIFPAEKVLLAVSGGPSSCSMLVQVQEGLSQNAHKKLRFLPGIVYIDEGGALGQSLEERWRTVSELELVFAATGFPFHMVPLEQVLDLPSSAVVAATPPQPAAGSYKSAVDDFLRSDDGSFPTPQNKDGRCRPDVPEAQTQLLQQLLGSATTATAREELLSMFRQHLLVHTARTEGYSKLMLGDSCSSLAVRLLSSIAQGRGAQLAHDTGFSDCRYGDVVSVRPMREHSAKEITDYNRLFDVPSPLTPHAEIKDKSSIQSLTRGFVTKLQADFPSTVSTIYRTSEKLQTSYQSRSSGSGDTCLLCLCALDTALEPASAFQAMLISQRLSQAEACGGAPVTDQLTPVSAPDVTSATAVGCCSSGGGGCCSSNRSPGALRTLLCYSCQLTINDLSSVDHLPHYVLSEAQRRQRRCQMREEIRDFLLDDS